MQEGKDDDDDEDDEDLTTVTRADRYVFNEKHGELISISPDKRTATRRLAMICCDRGIAFSDQPLHDNEIFEVRIDQIIGMSRWQSHSVDIGKTYSCKSNGYKMIEPNIGKHRTFLLPLEVPPARIISELKFGAASSRSYVLIVNCLVWNTLPNAWDT